MVPVGLEKGRTIGATGTGGKAGSVALLLVAEVCAMAVWFASAAAVALLRTELPAAVSSGAVAWLTGAVQAGFVAGTACSALLSLADRIDPRRLFALSALVAAVSTAALAFLPPVGVGPVALRFVAGACMAGVYPVGMRIAASWARPGIPGGRGGDLGLLIGLLVGGLTLGSAAPHLVAGLPSVGWRGVYGGAAGLAALSAALACCVTLGPGFGRAARIDLRRVSAAWRHHPLRLANLGYLGHMWELYAMWAWLGVFLHSSFAASGLPGAAALAEVATFAVIAAGALGAWGGGALADRVGRTAVTVGAMACSAACAAGIGFLHGAPPWLLLPVALVWGVTVIADSAQFSATVAELAPPDAVGTLLTAQTCAGFLLTLASIHLLPHAVAAVGWPGAFAMLAAGPLLGCAAMLRLRRDPAATRLAGGRR